MCPEDTPSPDDDPLARISRIIYDQMDIEPRRMHVAIELAKQHLAEIREALVNAGLRAEATVDAPSTGR